MSHEDIIADALSKHPDCAYGDWDNGMDCMFRLTRVVKLWRTEECYLAGDPPRHFVQGYPAA